MTDLLPGTYCCVKTGGPFGWIIRKFTSSPVNHTVVVVGPDEIVEARIRGVKQNPLSTYAGALACANVGENLAPWERGEIAAAALAYATAKDEYAMPAVIVIGLRKLGLKWKWLLKASADHDALFCSELAVKCAQRAGVDWTCGTGDPALVTPAMLAQRHGVVPVVIGR